jgi:hypothetical protein
LSTRILISTYTCTYPSTRDCCRPTTTFPPCVQCEHANTRTCTSTGTRVRARLHTHTCVYNIATLRGCTSVRPSYSSTYERTYHVVLYSSRIIYHRGTQTFARRHDITPADPAQTRPTGAGELVFALSTPPKSAPRRRLLPPCTINTRLGTRARPSSRSRVAIITRTPRGTPPGAGKSTRGCGRRARCRRAPRTPRSCWCASPPKGSTPARGSTGAATGRPPGSATVNPPQPRHHRHSHATTATAVTTTTITTRPHQQGS